MNKEEKEFLLELLKKDKEKVIKFLGYYCGVRIFFGLIGFIIMIAGGYYILKGMYNFEKEFYKDRVETLKLLAKRSNDFDDNFLAMAKASYESSKKFWEEKGKRRIEEMKKEYPECFDKNGNIKKEDSLCYRLYKTKLSLAKQDIEIWVGAEKEFYDVVKKGIKNKKEFERMVYKDLLDF